MINRTAKRAMRAAQASTRRSQSTASPMGENKKKIASLEALQTTQKPVATRKGFSNLKQVPSTMDLEPKHILLDRLYQGHQPLILPHAPDMLTDKTKKPLFINILEGISIEDYDRHLTVEEMPEDDGTFHSPTMMFSKYIFNKNPATERNLESLDKALDAPESPKVGKLAKKLDVREGMNGRGRVRVQFGKKSCKTSKKTQKDPLDSTDPMDPMDSN